MYVGAKTRGTEVLDCGEFGSETRTEFGIDEHSNDISELKSFTGKTATRRHKTEIRNSTKTVQNIEKGKKHTSNTRITNEST